MCSNDSPRDRLNEIADELAVLAAGVPMPSERDYAEALLAEAKRIERNAAGAAQAR
jgi:hypothetical protein